MKNKINYINPWIMQIDSREAVGRIFYTTDIHGCYDLLHEKMREVSFDSEKDILIVGGDIADRGQDSRYVLDYVAEPWLYCIRGNHEQLVIQTYEDEFRGIAADCLYNNGGAWYFNMQASNPSDARMVYELFKAMPLAIELITPTEKIGIIHAEVPRNDWCEFCKMTLPEIEYRGEAVAQWARSLYTSFTAKTVDPVLVKGVHRVMVGHTPTNSGNVEVHGNIWYCDLGAFWCDRISFIQLK